MGLLQVLRVQSASARGVGPWQDADGSRLRGDRGAAWGPRNREVLTERRGVTGGPHIVTVVTYVDNHGVVDG
jgi:hypothetical protein